jgi:type VI secretion system protein ImpE
VLAEQSLRDGRLQDALTELQDQVRKDPSNPRYRVFLFQLLCVLGDWARARDQLKVLPDLDPGSLALVHVYGQAIACELLRQEVFAGARTPLLLGEPLPWVALLLQALAASAQGAHAEAKKLRADALEQARALPGTIDGQEFEWIADADARLGPVCEAVIEGRYYWVPFERIRSVVLETPSDLRDFVWVPAQLGLANGGEAAALLPTRYPGSEADPDSLIRLARKTEWDEVASDTFHGRGQRMLATDGNEYPLLNVRRVEMRAVEA